MPILLPEQTDVVAFGDFLRHAREQRGLARVDLPVVRHGLRAAEGREALEAYAAGAGRIALDVPLLGEHREVVVDVARRRDAHALMEGSMLELQDIATRLGYNNPANFTRAFRKWTGTSPTGHRSAQR